MTSYRRPRQVPSEPCGRAHDRSSAPEHYTIATDVAVSREPAAARGAAISATVAGFDGTIIATISRHDEYEQPGGVLAVVGVAGDVDRDSVPLLHTALTSAIDANPRVCCDLGEVDFFGAAGANTVLAAHWHAVTAGRHFTVRGVHGLTRLVFGVTGLDRVLAVNA